MSETTEATKETLETPEGVDVADGKASLHSREKTHKKTDVTERDDTDSQAAFEEAATQEDTCKEDAEAAGTEDSTEAKDAQPQEKEPTPLEKALQESAKYKEEWQRERAEFVNYRKRAMQENAQIRDRAVIAVIHDLLEPLDNLERVLAAKSENAEVANFIEGVRMIQSQFLGVLEKYNVKPINPKDEPFDPVCMEALATEESEDLDSEKILEVYQVGYKQEEGQVIRPARVKVGRPKTQTENQNEGGNEEEKK